MTELTFRIEHRNDGNKVTVLEDGAVRSSTYYHRNVDDNTMILHTVKDWIGDDDEN